MSEIDHLHVRPDITIIANEVVQHVNVIFLQVLQFFLVVVAKRVVTLKFLHRFLPLTVDDDRLVRRKLGVVR